jgi:Trypsin
LTAGHCKDRHLTAAVGRYSFAHDDDDKQDSFFAGYYNVIAQARHPLWIRKGDDEFEHDFLLLKLNQTLPRDHPIVLLNDNPEWPNSGDEVTAMGVGWTHVDRESRADTLREVQLNAMSNEDCRVSKNEELSYRKRIFPSHLCTTGGENNDRDAWYEIVLLYRTMLNLRAIMLT